ncbi:MAG: response regulator [Bacteroidales bacterium]|nr:response regulator [Bacteroidales bacterium]
MKNNEPKILVIDDNQDNLISIKALIRESFPNAEILTAQSGSKGLEVAAGSIPDVILLDIVMPGMDGFEVCRRLKANNLLAEIPVIFITALKGDKESRIKALEAGGEAFLAKPVDESELTAQIRAMLKIRQAALEKHDEKENLEKQVEERTKELEKTHTATLNLLEDLKTENQRRKESEEALKQSAGQFRQLIETLPISLSIVTVSGNILYINPKCRELFETGEIPENDKAFFHWVNPEERKRWIQEIKEKGAVKNFEMHLKTTTGKEIWVLGSGLFIQYKNQTCVLSTQHDITEVKKAQDALRESEARFAAFMDNLPITTFIKNQEHTLLYVNKFMKKTFSDSEWKAKTPYDVLPKQLAQKLIEDDNKSFEQGYGVNEYLVPDKEGNEKNWETHVFRIDRENLEPLIGGFSMDITKRKQAEENLHHLSQMQSIILRMASDYINMPKELVEDSINNSLKELGEFVQADRAYIFEYDWTKNVCNNTYEWCNEGINPEIDNLQNVPNELIDYWVEAHKNGKEMNIVDVMQLPPDDGVRKILEPQGVKSVLALPMMKLDKCIGFIGFDSVRKIHKYSEKEKTLLKVFSEMLVNIGNRIELEKNLVQAKEKAEESDRLKSAFLANMSHEIRTPMNGILGFADLLKEPDLTGEKQQKYIRIIERSGKRMLNIINDIVDIAKIEAGLMELKLKPTNINEQIEYIYTFFKPEAESKGIKLSFNNPLPAKEATIKTDSEKVYAILTNLVKNALKYTHKGSVEFGYVSTGLSADKAGSTTQIQSEAGERSRTPELEFYVKDTGIGIPHDRQEAIFERFIQADIADKMAYQGAGLGLAITKNYVEMLGGKMWVESEEGKGSTFYFTLPYNSQPKKETNDIQPEPTENNNDIRKLKMLIAEDDEVSELLIDSYINPFAKDVLKAKTGVETIKACRHNPDIDLILMDIRMPDMGGYEACQKIREFNSEVVIIAQTAYGLSGDREKAIEAGCNDYIAKPINKNKLQALIQKYFGE